MATKNHLKGASFTYAFKRINEAIDQGFYLEAVTLAESSISDRLLSFVKYHNGKVNVKTNFHTLISSAKKFNTANALTKSGEDLFDALDRWRIQRNTCVHSVAKSEPNEPTLMVNDFNAMAKASALEGKSLARLISNWHRSSKNH